MPTNRAVQEGDGPGAVMRAVLSLLADEREARIANDKEARKTEALLADAGLSIGEIASLLGKKYETVKTTLRRSRPAKAA